MQGRARRGTQRVQGERGTLALTLTLLALDLAVLFRVLLHFDVAITGGIARRAAAAWRETRWYGAGRREAQFHYVWELAIWKRREGMGDKLIGQRFAFQISISSFYETNRVEFIHYVYRKFIG